MVMFRYYLLGGDTAAPSRLYTKLCHAFLVFRVLNADMPIVDVRPMYQLVIRRSASRRSP